MYRTVRQQIILLIANNKLQIKFNFKYYVSTHAVISYLFIQRAKSRRHVKKLALMHFDFAQNEGEGEKLNDAHFPVSDVNIQYGHDAGRPTEVPEF